MYSHLWPRCCTCLIPDRIIIINDCLLNRWNQLVKVGCQQVLATGSTKKVPKFRRISSINSGIQIQTSSKIIFPWAKDVQPNTQNIAYTIIRTNIEKSRRNGESCSEFCNACLGGSVDQFRQSNANTFTDMWITWRPHFGPCLNISESLISKALSNADSKKCNLSWG